MQTSDRTFSPPLRISNARPTSTRERPANAIVKHWKIAKLSLSKIKCLAGMGHKRTLAPSSTRPDPITMASRGAFMRRRDFVRGALGSAAVWPLSALAQQQPSRPRVIGALTGIGDDSETKVRYAAFRQELQRLGWVDGQNVRIEVRFGEGDAARMRK